MAFPALGFQTAAGPLGTSRPYNIKPLCKWGAPAGSASAGLSLLLARGLHYIARASHERKLALLMCGLGLRRRSGGGAGRPVYCRWGRPRLSRAPERIICMFCMSVSPRVLRCRPTQCRCQRHANQPISEHCSSSARSQLVARLPCKHCR